MGKRERGILERKKNRKREQRKKKRY